MAINFPTLEQVINKAKTGIKNAIPNSNPWLRNSFLEVISKMTGGRVYDFYYDLKKNVLPELFLTTARNAESIEELVVPFSLNYIAGTKSSGIIIGQGIPPSAIPTGTEFQDSSGNIYTSLTSATIINQGLNIISLTQVGGVATATATNHGFVSGLSITITGANQAGYNLTFPDIIVIDKDTFTYQVDISTVTPATGTIIAYYTTAQVSVQSNEIGIDKNLSGGESLTITTPISGIQDEFFVKYPAFTGGTDLESSESLKQRGLLRYRNPSGNFTVGDIQRQVQLDVNNTRVWVQSITPDVGQVTVYFVRDNDGTGTAIIPNAANLLIAKNNITEIAPAPFDYTNDLFVAAPTPVTVNFSFSSISPSTTEMQTAIGESLTAFFQDSIDLGVNITEADYSSAIISTVDETGAKLNSFTLSSPSGDITIASGSLGILGSITF